MLYKREIQMINRNYFEVIRCNENYIEIISRNTMHCWILWKSKKSDEKYPIVIYHKHSVKDEYYHKHYQTKNFSMAITSIISHDSYVMNL